jgi:murein DD-endopeptidase MepM/ murein hydrolase activator NlpD
VSVVAVLAMLLGAVVPGPVAPGPVAPGPVADSAVADSAVADSAAANSPAAPAPPEPAAPEPARPPGTGLPAPGAAYAWPLAPAPVVLIPFRAPAHPYGPGHRGVDLAGSPDLPVLAARAGTVVFAGAVAGRGVVSVRHVDGLRTTYEPVRPVVQAGARVAAGAVLGLLEPGHPGCPAPACLHWGVRRDRAEYLDPLVLLRPARVRLLPVPVPWPLDADEGG